MTLDDVPSVGGKTASLGELFRELTQAGLRVPNGFAITADAYRALIDAGGVLPRMRDLVSGLDRNDLAEFARRGHLLRELVYQGPFPETLAREIVEAYAELCREYGENTDVAVRSSATAEDLPGVSFAGAHETYLNVRGAPALLDACHRCFASLFTDRAISYRIDQGFDHLAVALSVAVQKMVRSDLAASGVMFTLDTETGFRDVVLVNAAYGLGENVVQGALNPDEFFVFKPTLGEGRRPIIRRKLGEKKIKLIYGSGTSKVLTRNVEVPKAERRRFCIADDDVLELARAAVAIERHYSRRAGREQAMDIEWAKDGLSGQIFILQARPETVQSQRSLDFLEVYSLEHGATAAVLAQGTSVGEKIGGGTARVITDVHRLA
ncbi:MAG TPA: PEP/pyruvate-binding domain-containing protein, partial [Anaeromyxobacter sp.]|nr:PEP/pyruvate-binding domain-containing protein [Anaeromyxobacter sp.]